MLVYTVFVILTAKVWEYVLPSLVCVCVCVCVCLSVTTITKKIVDGFIFIFIHQKTVEKKNNTKTIKSERIANNLTKQVKICKHFPIQFITYSSIKQLISNHN